MQGYEWFQAGLGVAVAAYAIGYGVSAVIRATKAKSVCPICDEETEEEQAK